MAVQWLMRGLHKGSPRHSLAVTSGCRGGSPAGGSKGVKPISVNITNESPLYATSVVRRACELSKPSRV